MGYGQDNDDYEFDDICDALDELEKTEPPKNEPRLFPFINRKGEIKEMTIPGDLGVVKLPASGSLRSRNGYVNYIKQTVVSAGVSAEVRLEFFIADDTYRGGAFPDAWHLKKFLDSVGPVIWSYGRRTQKPIARWEP